jgi:hypothetical protein
MKPADTSLRESRGALPELVPSYAQRLAELEARRRAADDVILRKMLHSREPMSPG